MEKLIVFWKNTWKLQNDVYKNNKNIKNEEYKNNNRTMSNNWTTESI